MHLSSRILLEAVTVAGTLGCLFFYGLCLSGLIGFLGDARTTTANAQLRDNFSPPVSILKPLKGVDPEMFESFCSHAEQQYPEFELIFGVSDASDPACELVHRLQAKYPARAIKLFVAKRALGANVKVSNLAQMVREARYDVVVVNDSDIRVSSDYLRQVVAPLRDSEVGLVTCLYSGVAANTLGSKLEALTISTDFAPGVLAARFLENGLRFGLGSTLAFRRHDLEAIGGFEAIVDYLADDYELGRRIADTGKRVELSPASVVTFLPAYTLRQFWQHQLRWSRTIREARRWGYTGLLFTFGLPWSLAALIASSGAWWAWSLFMATLVARFSVGLGSELGILGEQPTLASALLIPVRDVIAPAIWAAGMAGNRIHWRGEDFDLRNGRLSKIEPNRN